MRRTFAEEVAAARPRVTAVARRLVGDEADDVVQEAVLRAFLSLSSLRDPDRFEAWLCGIALNVAKMRLRRAAIEARVLAAAASNNLLLAQEDRDLLDAVRDALDVLPPGQRDVVLMHYIDGLSCDEIAALLGSTPGAVRVRLHRARAQLRRELEPVEPIPEEEPMVEMTLDDVLLESEGKQDVVVILKERDGDRRLPIWIGLPEGAMLAYRLHDASPPRPMTTDLMVELLRVTGADVTRVAITEVRESVFYAAITVDGNEVDARPSDAINLAVRVGAPILVADPVLAHADAAKMPEGQWSSLSVEFLLELHQFPKKKE
jgi:RNA polymerase sigma factor (sigma-70 family)